MIVRQCIVLRSVGIWLASLFAVCACVAENPGTGRDPLRPGGMHETASSTNADMEPGNRRTLAADPAPGQGDLVSHAPKWHQALALWHADEPSNPANNTDCCFCHLNLTREELTDIHQPVGIGCRTCHGTSNQHSEDEDSITAPDIMLSKANVRTFCMECHRREDLLEEEEHEPLFAQPALSHKTCTDCHGEDHRVKVRTRKWDKETGKLVRDDGAD